MKNDVRDIETAVEDQGRRITELEGMKKESIDPQDKKILELETQLKEVKDHMTYQENRSRRITYYFTALVKLIRKTLQRLSLNV